jgi:DNA-directed RNA polymerase specialized sigma24 family protein
MSSSEDHFRSVTLLIQKLKDGSDDAASQLWRRYFNKLVGLAKQRLGNAPRRIADEEDVAINVFHSLCDGAENGRFERLDDRDELWKLLVAMTRHKTMNQLRHQTSQRFGYVRI